MTSEATTIEAYFLNMNPTFKPACETLFHAIQDVMPSGFEAIMNYGMIGWVVPKSIYPAGYHCDSKLPLPFAGLAAQKSGIHVYHMGIYSDPILLEWFQTEYAKVVPTKLDMGKSCIRFKKPQSIPIPLIQSLFSKITVEKWIQVYESTYLKK